jgi:hypothetical protein
MQQAPLLDTERMWHVLTVNVDAQFCETFACLTIHSSVLWLCDKEPLHTCVSCTQMQMCLNELTQVTKERCLEMLTPWGH